MTTNTYTASFTAGSLLHKETTALLPLFLSGNAKELINEEVKQNNLLKINSESSRKRTLDEISKRVSFFDHSFWEYYITRTEDEQKILLFYLCLKLYKLMFDFHFNVTLRQWNSSNPIVEPFLYRMELNEISGRVDTVYNWTDKTKEKAISVYMRILKDVKMLDQKTLQLKSLTITGDVSNYIVKQRELWFLDACLLSPYVKKNIINSAL